MLDATSISPIAFRLFGVDVYWYGVAYVISLWGALLYAKHICRRGGLSRLAWGGASSNIELRRCASNFDAMTIDNFFLLACCAVVIGGRLGHVLFFEPSYFLCRTWDILNIRAGGMSFHGGLLGLAISSYFFCRAKNIDIWRFVDVLATVAPIGLGIGRFANFINNELYGKPTQSCIGVIFRNVNEPRHPTQIYEALSEGIIMFIILRIFSNTRLCRKSPGRLFAIFLINYAAFRIIIDFFKESPTYYALTVGQWLSLLMLFCGIISLQRKV
ncbi:MAG: prolipoprotein diacylglyceryl transferase [Holosporales bacterium]|jgi:phosphatidylglycerol:prolipoprotein diacylglycerol transferase|nr:prolipoprotein diacylglyceryl transferase [Holosporales bacterium]